MKNKINLLVMQIPQDLIQEINQIRNKGFKISGNPTFKILDPYLILGIYNDSKLPIDIGYSHEDIIINKKAQIENGVLYYKIDNKNCIKDLIKDLNSKVEVIEENKYLPLAELLYKDKFPLILLASSFNDENLSLYDLKKNYLIKDLRLNILKIEFDDLGIIYSISDYRHLSKCK